MGKAKALEPTSRLSSPPFWPVASPFKKRNMKSRDSRTNNPHKPQIPSFQAPFCCLNNTRDSRAQSAQHGPQPSLHWAPTPASRTQSAPHSRPPSHAHQAAPHQTAVHSASDAPSPASLARAQSAHPICGSPHSKSVRQNQSISDVGRNTTLLYEPSDPDMTSL